MRRPGPAPGPSHHPAMGDRPDQHAGDDSIDIRVVLRCIRQPFECTLCAMKASRAGLLAITVLALLPLPVWSQAPAAEPKFEVASIEPNRSGAPSFGRKPTAGGRLTVRN